MVRNIVTLDFVTARAEYRAGVGIILVCRVTAEINYVRDEIPGPRGVTIENGSLPTRPRESTTGRNCGSESLLVSRVLPACVTFRLCHSEIKLAGSALYETVDKH